MKYIRRISTLLILCASVFLMQVNSASAITKCIGQPINLSWSSSNVAASGCSLAWSFSNAACAFSPGPDSSGGTSFSMSSGSCSVSLSCGSATSAASVTIDTTRTWNGSSCVANVASCPANSPYSETRPSAIANYCAATWGSCGPGTQYVSSLSCNAAPGWNAYGVACTAPSCGGCGCVPTASPVNGSCSASHYSCNAGSSINQNFNGSTYTWSCSGSNGGSTASCSESVSPPPPVLRPIDGQCGVTHYVCYNGTPASYVDGATSWTWNCNGIRGGASASCSEAKALPPPTCGNGANNYPSCNSCNAGSIWNGSSCVSAVYGCTSPSANDYNPSANVNDGSCCYGWDSWNGSVCVTPPPQISTLTAEPRTSTIGSASTVSWDIKYPTNSCTLTAQTVCIGGHGSCNASQLAAETTLNQTLTSGYTDSNDMYGANRLMSTAIKTVSPTSTTNARGKKTLQIIYTTDFTLNCSGVTKKVRYLVSTNTEG